MADSPEKTENSAEKAYAVAASGLTAEKPVVQSADEAPKADVVSKEAVAPVPSAAKPKAKKLAATKVPVAKKAAAPKAKLPATPARPKAAKKAPAKKAPPVKSIAKPAAPKPAAKKAPKKTAVWKQSAASSTTKPSVTDLKEKIMATKTKDITETMSKTMTDAVAEMQSKAKAAYEKSTETMAEMTELAKGNVEAFVESGKILAGGMQDLGKTCVDETKAAYETATADMKEMAAVKSPTELFQLQGKILRRNFDAFVASASKSSESAMKLANDVAAPLTGRVNLAAEKLSKVA